MAEPGHQGLGPRRCPCLTLGQRPSQRLGRGRRHDQVLGRDHAQAGPGEAARIDDLPGDTPGAARGRVLAVPAAQAFARDRRRQRDAVVQPVLQRHESGRLGAVRIEAREGEELAQHQLRVEAGEQPLDDVDRQFAARLHQRRQARQDGGHERTLGPGPGPGMEVPGRGQERQPGNIVLAPERQRQRQQPTHAVADHRRPRPGLGADRIERGLEPAGDVIGEREATFLGTRAIPVDQKRPQALPGEPAQQAAVGGKIEDIAAVDQRGHHQHRQGIAGPGRTVVEQSGGAGAPQHRRLGQIATVGMSAVAQNAVRQRQHACVQVTLDRGLEGFRAVVFDTCPQRRPGRA